MSADGLNSRTTSWPASRTIALTSAPLIESAWPVGAPVAAAPPPRVTCSGSDRSSTTAYGSRPPRWTANRASTRCCDCGPSIARQRAGGQRAGGHRALRQHPGAAQQRDRQRAGGRGGVVEVDQLVLEQPLVGDGEPAGGDEAARRVGGEPLLGGTALGDQPALDGGEGALGHRRAGSLREREDDAQAVVAHAVVVELDVHPHEVVAGAQLEGGEDLHRPRAGAGAVGGVGGEVVGAADLEPGAHRSGLDDARRHRRRRVHHDVAVGRAPVVGVADVAAVDELPETAVAVDREGAVGGIDVDRDDPVGQPVLRRP